MFKKEEREPCERILGSFEYVKTFASFWKHNSNQLMALSAIQLQEMITSQNLTKDEIALYKKGQADIALFFAKCFAEVEKKK